MSRLDLTRPSGEYVAISASDTVDIVPPRGLEGEYCRFITVGTAGVATLIDLAGNQRTGVPLVVGKNDIRAKRVFSTGLTAANLWAMF